MRFINVLISFVLVVASTSLLAEKYAIFTQSQGCIPSRIPSRIKVKLSIPSLDFYAFRLLTWSFQGMAGWTSVLHGAM